MREFVIRNGVRHPLMRRGWLVHHCQKQKWKCALCGQQMIRDKFMPRGATLDHILPISKGGANVFENTQAACRDCNQAKSNKIPNDVKRADPETLKRLSRVYLFSVDDDKELARTIAAALAEYEESNEPRREFARRLVALVRTGELPPRRTPSRRRRRPYDLPRARP